MQGDAIVRARLQAVPGVTGLIGGVPPADRIYKWWLPENPVYPAIALRLNGTERVRGTYGDPGYCKSTVQVICLTNTNMDDADALADAVRLALERFGSNQPAGIPFAGTTLYDIEVGSQAQGYSFEAEVFFVSTDYTVHHLETTP